MISKPGIYTDIAAAVYHADPCPAPSLTQSVAKVLLERSPLHAWHAHPRLNPDYQHDDATKFDIGNVAHKMLLGRGKEIVVLEDFDDWRTKDAKALREVAASEGKLAVLGKQAARADRMVNAARAQLELRGIRDLFGADGDSEVVLAWQEGPVWLRQMADWLSDDRLIFADYKTTDESAAPAAVARKMVNDGWHIQAAMGERGLTALGFDAAKFLFVVQEATVPYALTVVEIGADALTMGRKMLDAAVLQWSRCMRADRFPGYPLDIVTPEFPGWAEQQWLDREIKDAARARVPQPDDLIMAG
jgi:hypothetical protein